MNFRALHDSIIFQFTDETDKNGFSNVTTSGIVFKSYDHDTKAPRWGKAIKIGPDVKYVKENDIILIENLRWTEKHEIDGISIWRTTEPDVIGIQKAD